jgi:hypothetical protein
MTAHPAAVFDQTVVGVLATAAFTAFAFGATLTAFTAVFGAALRRAEPARFTLAEALTFFAGAFAFGAAFFTVLVVARAMGEFPVRGGLTSLAPRGINPNRDALRIPRNIKNLN